MVFLFTITIYCYYYYYSIKILLLQVKEFEKYPHASHRSRGAYDRTFCLSHVFVACSRTAIVFQMPLIDISFTSSSKIFETTTKVTVVVLVTATVAKKKLRCVHCIHFLAQHCSQGPQWLDPGSSWLIMATTPSCHFIWVAAFTCNFIIKPWAHRLHGAMESLHSYYSYIKIVVLQIVESFCATTILTHHKRLSLLRGKLAGTLAPNNHAICENSPPLQWMFF